MKTKRETVIKGIACSILVEEVLEVDGDGKHLFTLSSVYILDASGKTLLRRSRLPNAVETLKREIRRDGIQVFHRLQKSIILK